MKVAPPQSWLAFIVCILACLSPLYFMANSIDADEHEKGLAGLVLAAVVAVINIFFGGNKSGGNS